MKIPAVEELLRLLAGVARTCAIAQNPGALQLRGDVL